MQTKTLKTALSILIGFTAVSLVSAQGVEVTQGIKSFSSLVDVFTNTVVRSLATLFMSLAMLAFFWGIVQYIWGRRQGDAGKIKVGNDFMTWGLVALFVMFSVYGIIRFSQSVLLKGVDTKTIDIPNIQFKSGSSSNNNSPTFQSSPGTGVGGIAPRSSPGTATGGATNTGGCSVQGQICNFGGAEGSCQQNAEDGSLYCQPSSGSPTQINYGADGSCPEGTVVDESVPSGCAPAN